VVIKTQHPRGIFNAETIRLVAELTDELNQIEGVRDSDLFSLATEHGHRVVPGTLRFRRFLDPLPETEKRLDTLRDDLRRIELYNGTLISKDEQSTAVMVGTPHGVNRIELYNAIRDITSARQTPTNDLVVIGAPVAEALLGTHLLEDLGVPHAILGVASTTGDESDLSELSFLQGLRVWIARHIGLVPVAIFIIALVFLATFRNLTAVALPMAEVGAAIVFVFALIS